MLGPKRIGRPAFPPSVTLHTYYLKRGRGDEELMQTRNHRILLTLSELRGQSRSEPEYLLEPELIISAPSPTGNKT